MSAGWPLPALASARAALIAGLLCCCGSALAAAPQRIVSINACTDQLLFEIADPPQIAALTYLAGDPAFSHYAAAVKARGVPLISGSAEEVLKLEPSLVLTGSWTKSATRALIERRGIPLELFEPELDVAAAIAAIEKTGRLTGHEDRAAALIRGIEAALAAAPHFSGGRPLTALQIQRRGYASGRQTLAGDVLSRMGVANAADALGIGSIGAVSLEGVLKARPDVLIVTTARLGAPDQGTALLQHPAIQAAYPPERRITLPAGMSECGGAALAELIRALGAGLRRVPR